MLDQDRIEKNLAALDARAEDKSDPILARMAFEMACAVRYVQSPEPKSQGWPDLAVQAEEAAVLMREDIEKALKIKKSDLQDVISTVRFLRELESKAQDNVLQQITVKNSMFECLVIIFVPDPASNEHQVTYKFMLNGNEFIFRGNVSQGFSTADVTQEISENFRDLFFTEVAKQMEAGQVDIKGALPV